MSTPYNRANDSDLPLVRKPSLEGYDPYQIYNICCLDNLDDPSKIGGGFLAIQQYAVNPITCDFMAIVNTYK